MTKKYRSDAFAAIHETREALHDVGAIDKRTMREFDDACLTPVQVLTIVGDALIFLLPDRAVAKVLGFEYK